MIPAAGFVRKYSKFPFRQQLTALLGKNCGNQGCHLRIRVRTANAASIKSSAALGNAVIKELSGL
jgi:hypothetical protein